jgi:hypothetical protein
MLGAHEKTGRVAGWLIPLERDAEGANAQLNGRGGGVLSVDGGNIGRANWGC